MSLLEISRERSITHVRLRREAKRNALSVEMCAELESALADAHLTLISAEGPVFSAGADLRSEDFQGRLYPALERLFSQMAAHPYPIISFIDGPAIGAGMMLAMVCDIRVATSRAWFSLPVADMAIGVDSSTIDSLESLVGGSIARQMLLAGTKLSVEAAVSSGFVLPGSWEDALTLADAVAAKAPLTQRQIKLALAGTEPSEVEKARLAAWASEDFRESARARAEKRPPRFQGR